jgi:ABC-2 type transport system permease protein
VWSIAKRDIRAMFVSPIMYIVLTAWLLLSGWSFYLLASMYAQRFSTGGSDTPLSAFFGQTTLFYLPLLLFVPALTMRLVSEERQSGTIETLLTAPVTEAQVVAGKYLAALTYWLTLWLPTLLYVFITANYGDVDPGVVASSYLGVFGIGLYYMAIGLAMSVVARSQIVSAVLTFLVLTVLFILGLVQFLQTEDIELWSYISVWSHMDAFSKGIVDSRYLVFDATLAGVALFFATCLLKLRRLA